MGDDFARGFNQYRLQPVIQTLTKTRPHSTDTRRNNMPTHRYEWTPARHAVYQHFVDLRGGPHGEGVSPDNLMKDMGSRIVGENNFTYDVLQSYLQRDRNCELKKRRARYDAQRNAEMASAAPLVAPPGPTSAQPPVAPRDPARAQPLVAPPVPASAQPQVAAAETPRAGPSRAPGNHEARVAPPDPETSEDTEPPSVLMKKRRVAPAPGAEAANDGFASPAQATEQASLSSTRASADDAQESGVAEMLVTFQDTLIQVQELKDLQELKDANKQLQRNNTQLQRNNKRLQRNNEQLQTDNKQLQHKVLGSNQSERHALDEVTKLKRILRKNGISLTNCP